MKMVHLRDRTDYAASLQAIRTSLKIVRTSRRTFPNASSRAEAADKLADRSLRLSFLDRLPTIKQNLGGAAGGFRSAVRSLTAASVLLTYLACCTRFGCRSPRTRRQRLADRDSRTARIDQQGVLRHSSIRDFVPAYSPERLRAVVVWRKVRSYSARSTSFATKHGRQTELIQVLSQCRHSSVPSFHPENDSNGRQTLPPSR